MHFFIFLKLILHHIHNFNLSVGLVGILKPVKYSVGIFNRQDHISKVSTLWVSHSITHMASLASHSAKHTTFSLGQKGPGSSAFLYAFFLHVVCHTSWMIIFPLYWSLFVSFFLNYFDVEATLILSGHHVPTASISAQSSYIFNHARSYFARVERTHQPEWSGKNKIGTVILIFMEVKNREEFWKIHQWVSLTTYLWFLFPGIKKYQSTMFLGREHKKF